MSRGRVVPLRRVEGRAEEMSDEALVAACAVGDRAALGALFDRHHLRVHRFVCRVAGVPSEDGEDLLQDTFTAVWSAAARYRSQSSALTWLFGIAANVARNHARGRDRKWRALDVMGKQPDPETVPLDEMVARREAVKKLERSIATLSHDHRVALVMCDLEGATGYDAAAALGVRPGTIWRRLHEARNALRAAMESAR